MAAKNILQVAERVEKALAEAQNLQKEVEDGIFTTNQNIEDATNTLTKVSTFVIFNLKSHSIFIFNIKYLNHHYIHDF